MVWGWIWRVLRWFKMVFLTFWTLFSDPHLAPLQALYCLVLCWNFEPFVSAPRDSYRDELKTHKRYALGEGFGPKIS